MALCALFPSPLFGIPKSHEVLALAAFIAVCVDKGAASAIAKLGVPGGFLDNPQGQNPAASGRSMRSQR
jgi:hypothetical protein